MIAFAVRGDLVEGYVGRNVITGHHMAHALLHAFDVFVIVIAAVIDPARVVAVKNGAGLPEAGRAACPAGYRQARSRRWSSSCACTKTGTNSARTSAHPPNRFFMNPPSQASLARRERHSGRGPTRQWGDG